ncbi:MAG: alpha/beta hydrolase [Actinobacteria bacterium]|nr:alpha/beta hydrolase [Actinomycetota bacterium]MBI3686656.1 alpha/beta hydrolase [Actinomycetota bacterium]
MADTIETPHGPARVHRSDPVGPVRAFLMLGHGAGVGIDTPDLVAVTEAAVATGITVCRVEQPFRVAGRRAPAPARQLDAAWHAVVAAVPRPAGVPLVVGGRSMGARVACRTAATVGAAAVLCLAFPAHPPRRPDRSRLTELAAVRVPVLVVQGDRDPFGMPPSAPGRMVHVVPGADHALRVDPVGMAEVVASWLLRTVRPLPMP